MMGENLCDQWTDTNFWLYLYVYIMHIVKNDVKRYLVSSKHNMWHYVRFWKNECVGNFHLVFRPH
jgi:hypothetical protein